MPDYKALGVPDALILDFARFRHPLLSQYTGEAMESAIRDARVDLEFAYPEIHRAVVADLLSDLKGQIEDLEQKKRRALEDGPSSAHRIDTELQALLHAYLTLNNQADNQGEAG